MVARMKAVAMGMEKNGWIQDVLGRFISYDLVDGYRSRKREKIQGRI